MSAMFTPELPTLPNTWRACCCCSRSAEAAAPFIRIVVEGCAVGIEFSPMDDDILCTGILLLLRCTQNAVMCSERNKSEMKKYTRTLCWNFTNIGGGAYQIFGRSIVIDVRYGYPSIFTYKDVVQRSGHGHKDGFVCLVEAGKRLTDL